MSDFYEDGFNRTRSKAGGHNKLGLREREDRSRHCRHNAPHEKESRRVTGFESGVVDSDAKTSPIETQPEIRAKLEAGWSLSPEERAGQ